MTHKFYPFTLLIIFIFYEVGFSQISQQQILAVLDKQAESWNNGNIDAYMDGYWKSEELIFTSSGKITMGWKATLDKYKKSYDTKDKMGILNFSDLEVKMLAESSAYVLGKWELKRKDDNPKGIFTLIFKKMKEGWRVIHDHTSVLDEKK
jgi:ketosteroid isomerase-like protein